MVTLYVLATIAGQVPPATKTCPDRSVVLATQECAQMPEHRFEFTHEPHRETLAVEWWCGGDRRPSSARFMIRQHQRRAADGRPAAPVATVELASLVVKGRPAHPATVNMVRQRLASLNGVGALSGRCRYQRGGGVQSVLDMHGYRQGRREPHGISFDLR